MKIPTFLLPNEKVSGNVMLTLAAGWVFIVAGLWYLTSVPMIPTPSDTFGQVTHQWTNGAASQIIASLTVSVEAIALATLLSAGLSYLATIPLFRPFVEALAKLRFLSLTGTILIFVASFHGHALKVAVLTFGILGFLINDILRVIDTIPSGKFDHARTLGLNRWEVLREVVIRGTLHEVLDSIRMNAAIAWMMLTTVESLSRSEGGIGVLLLSLSKSFNIPAIMAIQLMVFVVGIGQDYALKYLKGLVCPYTVRS